MSGSEERPAWFARREIAPFKLDDDAVNDLINRATHASVSWVTKNHEPVSAIMLYVLVDGVITVTSTTNRAKFHAWKRNPAACFNIWDPKNIGHQVTLRGRIEIMQDMELLSQFTEGFLTRAMGGQTPTEERLQEEIDKFGAPDRHMMQLHIDKVLSHDLNSLLKAEAEGTDVWS